MDGAQVSSGYPMGQLRRAMEAAERHPDPAVRRRARAKAERWRQVWDGMVSGSITVGSRTPVADTPAWVTLEVVHGGFATGGYLAEQPLRPDETAVLAAAGAGPGGTDRERLNLWYLGDAGQEVLRAALAERRFRVDVPEDAALLVATWLLAHDRPVEALDLVAQLRPLMHRLRLTPRFESVTRTPDSLVRRESTGRVAGRLRAVRVPPPVLAMRATLGGWHPLFDRLVALWCDTVAGELPRVGADGTVVGGWPCRQWPADWAERRAAWLADCAAVAERYPMSRRQHGPRSDFDRLRRTLERCVTGSATLTGRDVGWVRRALANTITRHGAPGSPQRLALRAGQAAVVAAPTHAAVAGVVAARLDRYPSDGGLSALEPVVVDVAEGESTDVPAGSPVPGHLVDKVARAWEAPVRELVARGIVGSGEVLAEVLPQITAGVAAADLGDPALSEVYRQTYAAFRRRRSLLLLDLASQVRFEELPWVAAVQPLRAGGADGAATARRVLEEATALFLDAFPHTITPNPLVVELAGLARRAGLDLPLVQEVAADIFVGEFTDTWRRAAAAAGTLLSGTLYARYYDLPPASAWRAPRKWRRVADGFAEACRVRAREATTGSGGGVARNGAVLEQSQILTTQNLAVLVDALDLRDALVADGPRLAAGVFARVVRDLGRRAPSWHAEAIALKNAAYAWRQAVFLLSFADVPVQQEAVDRLRDAVEAADPPPAFGLAVDGLRHVVDGGSFDADGRTSGDRPGRRFLGWSVGPHWLERPDPPTRGGRTG